MIHYKKLFKNKRIRHFILGCLKWIPDSMMVKIQYWLTFNRRLDLKNLDRFSEKIQWYKLFYRNDLIPICADKYNVRQFVESKGLRQILNTLYGVFDNPEDIDFYTLPGKFVIKTTDGSGGENVFICKNKTAINIPALIKTLKSWKNKKKLNLGREWAYTQIKKSRYIVEEYIENPVNPNDGIEDYKLYCFNGVVKFFHVDYSRFTGHKRNFYDKDGNYIPVVHTYPNFDPGNVCLDNLNTLISVAENLSSDFIFVRVDLYSVQNRIYFGELTFYPGSGYESFIPDEFDLELGSHFDINYRLND